MNLFKKILPVVSFAIASSLIAHAQSSDSAMPHIVKDNGRAELMVDGKPYLMLGAQMGNSSAWPIALPNAWDTMEELHVNTVEAPVYWEVMEPQPDHFDFTNVDNLIDGAREHHLHLVLLWFGTWKNGQNHYVPEWMKSDIKKYPREISAYGKVLDVMSPHSETNLAADAHAFAALMRHVREKDSTQHTVIMMQVENESGAIGTIRDHTPAANEAFQKHVPSVLRTKTGTWSEVYGQDADERFAAYYTAKYIGEVAQAGKKEYALPMYCNVWIAYPVHALENRDRPTAGQEYPSGGPQQENIDIWKAAAPAIDVLAPDFYSSDRQLFRDTIATYHRADNPLFIPETHHSNDFGPNLFYALGQGAIGFSPFGVDSNGFPTSAPKPPDYVAENYSLLKPIASQLAALNFDGKLQTVVESKGEPQVRIHLDGTDAIVRFGFPQHDGEVAPGTQTESGRVLITQTGPLQFLVTGFDASVTFVAADSKQDEIEILRAEQVVYDHDQWQSQRVWNGDQTDRGLQFHGKNSHLVSIRLQRIPAYLR